VDEYEESFSYVTGSHGSRRVHFAVEGLPSMGPGPELKSIEFGRSTSREHGFPETVRMSPERGLHPDSTSPEAGFPTG